MLVLAIRTDKPEAEIGLFEAGSKLGYEAWEAHRALAETLHIKISDLLKSQSKSFADLQGIAVFKGPGSFTGLRIGIAAGNALAYSLGIPVVGETGDDWVAEAIEQLNKGRNEIAVIPEYGHDAHTTKPRK